MDTNKIDAAKIGGSGIDDRLAQDEAKRFLGETKRSEQRKATIHMVSVVFIISLAFLASVVIWVRVMHFVFPTDMRWLSPEQISTMDDLIFHGAAGAGILSFARKSFEFEKSQLEK